MPRKMASLSHYVIPERNVQKNIIQRYLSFCEIIVICLLCKKIAKEKYTFPIFLCSLLNRAT